MLAKEPNRRPDAVSVASRLNQIARRLQGNKSSLRIAGPALAICAAAGGVFWLWSSRQVVPTSSPPRFTQFTTLQGREIQPSFSPDGRRVAFVWDGPEGLNRDIYIQNVDADTPNRLTSDPAEDINPVWSPDGKEIAFLRRARTDDQYSVFIIGADGHNERSVGKIAELEYFHGVLAWWPDGRSLIVRDVSMGTVGFVRLILQTGEKIPMTAPSGSTDRDSDIAVSPDGRRFAFLRRRGGTMHDQICIGELTGKGQNCYAVPAHPGNLVWWRDGQELLYTTPEATWRVAANRTMSDKRFKFRDGALDDLAADRSGHRLVASRGNIDLNLWRVDRWGKNRVKLIASTKEESDAQYSPDGKQIVFRSDRSGTLELWISNQDGSGQTRITNLGGRLGSARWSPDGKYIAFDAYASPVLRSANTNVYVLSISDRNVRRLTDDKALYFVPNWSNDGRWIYCVKQTGTRWETYKAPLEGGPLVQVSSTGMFDLTESADGKEFYYTTPRGKPGIWHRPADGGQEALVPGTEKVSTYRYWQLTPTGIYFAEGPSDPVVQFLNLKTGVRTRLAPLGSHFRKGPRGLAVSPDGLSFLYAQEDDRQSDLYLTDRIP
jgi:Tol biopolymer transport system component